MITSSRQKNLHRNSRISTANCILVVLPPLLFPINSCSLEFFYISCTFLMNSYRCRINYDFFAKLRFSFFKNLVPYTIFAPSIKSFPDRWPFTITFWQFTPTNTSFNYVQYSINKKPIVFSFSAKSPTLPGIISFIRSHCLFVMSIRSISYH